MIIDADPEISESKRQALLQEQQVHAISIQQAENSSAYLFPKKIADVSTKDRARLIVAISQYAENLKRENMQLDLVARSFHHHLNMLLTPVSDQ